MSTDRLPLAVQYIERHNGNIRDAVIAFVADLEQGDPATFKAGYSRENAVLAAADAFDITPGDIRVALWGAEEFALRQQANN